MPRVDERIAWQVVAGEVILFDLDAGRAIGLNESAAFLWRRFQDLGEDELADALVTEFEVTRDAAVRDVERFVTRLRGLGIVRDAA